MGLFSKKPTLVVHDGRFHSDDIFAAATLRILLNGRLKILRTRDPKVIESADYVADVGGIHNPAAKRFDHHQKGGAGTHDNGVPYAAFGLVWREYGAALCGSAEVAARIERGLVCSIDASDNGVETYTPSSEALFPYLIQRMFGSFMPTWKEESLSLDKQFLTCVAIAEKILAREITQAKDYVEAESAVRKIYDATEDKRLIVLDKMYPWEELLTQYKEPLMIIASRGPGRWKAEPTLVKKGSFERRMYFPQAWAGLRDEELQKVTGVSDAIFCHNGRFIVVAGSKKGVQQLVDIVLNNK